MLNKDVLDIVWSYVLDLRVSDVNTAIKAQAAQERMEAIRKLYASRISCSLRKFRLYPAGLFC